jgi:hypothetical protein
MTANAKPALEKIRRIQKPKTSAIQAIPQNSTKFFSHKRTDRPRMHFLATLFAKSSQRVCASNTRS